MHEFSIGQRRFGRPDPEDRLMGMPSVENERTVRLSGILGRVGSKAIYTYDFGDSWEHSLVLEKSASFFSHNYSRFPLTCTRADSLVQFWCVALYPSPQCGVVDRQIALGHRFFQIAITKREAQLLAYALSGYVWWRAPTSRKDQTFLTCSAAYQYSGAFRDFRELVFRSLAARFRPPAENPS